MSPFSENDDYNKAKILYSEYKKFDVNLKDGVVFIDGILHFKYNSFYIPYIYYRLIPDNDNVFFMKTP